MLCNIRMNVNRDEFIITCKTTHSYSHLFIHKSMCLYVGLCCRLLLRDLRESNNEGRGKEECV